MHVIIGITVIIAEDAELMDVVDAMAAAATDVAAVTADVAVEITDVAVGITTGSARHTAEVTLTATA